MRAEYLPKWFGGATPGELPDIANWDLVVQLIHTAFRNGQLSTECQWQTVVLSPQFLRIVHGHQTGISHLEDGVGGFQPLDRGRFLLP